MLENNETSITPFKKFKPFIDYSKFFNYYFTI